MSNAMGSVYEEAPAGSRGVHDCIGTKPETRSRYGVATVTERRGTDHEKSELASSTGEAGEPDRRDPVEGRGRRI